MEIGVNLATQIGWGMFLLAIVLCTWICHYYGSKK